MIRLEVLRLVQRSCLDAGSPAKETDAGHATTGGGACGSGRRVRESVVLKSSESLCTIGSGVQKKLAKLPAGGNGAGEGLVVSPSHVTKGS